ncbi:MFS transporter [Amycolatopsis lurida]
MTITERPPRVLSRELGILTFCQFLYYSGLAVDLTLTAVVGMHLASTLALATVPLSIMGGVSLVSSFFAGTLSAKLGHRTILLAGALAATLGALVSMWAVLVHNFALLCLGTAIVGLYKATGGYFRYLAADRAPEGGRTRALSIVLTGGVAGAVAGPWSATLSADLFGAKYAGSYLLVALLAVAVVGLVLFVKPKTRTAQGEEAERLEPVRIRDAAATPNFRRALVLLGSASGLMTLLMAMGPIASSSHGHSGADAALIIQWHMVGMFAPSLFSGKLVGRWGAAPTAAAGTGLLLAGALWGAMDSSALGYAIGLGLVGVGWNFLYVAGSDFTIRTYPAGRGGRVQGAIEASAGSITVLGSLSSAGIFGALGWTGTNLLAAVLCATVLGWLLLVVRPAEARKEAA